MDIPQNPKLSQVGNTFAHQWIEAIRAGAENKIWDDLTTVRTKFSFNSPAVHSTYDAKGANFLLRNVLHVLQGLYYVEVFVGTDTKSNTARVALHFRAKITTDSGSIVEADGIDLFEVDGDSGKAVALTVMVRPFTALSALKQQMGKRIAAAGMLKPKKSKL
ncbi:hypothetical protein DIPPA_06544 [Diplonema papillatum]|nr:hypothetical protein DIPPA_06544 [Diplonema papillatum]